MGELESRKHVDIRKHHMRQLRRILLSQIRISCILEHAQIEFLFTSTTVAFGVGPFGLFGMFNTVSFGLHDSTC